MFQNALKKLLSFGEIETAWLPLQLAGLLAALLHESNSVLFLEWVQTLRFHLHPRKANMTMEKQPFEDVPSRERTYPTKREKENNLQKCLG